MIVSDLWNELESEMETLRVEEWVVRRLNPDSAADIRVGVDGSTRNRTLLVRVVNSAIRRSSSTIRGNPSTTLKKLVSRIE